MSSNIQLLTDNPTLNDMTIQHNSEYIHVSVTNSAKVPLTEVPNTIWTINNICVPAGAASSLFLDHDLVAYLKLAYETMYKYQFTNTPVSFVATKHSRIKIGHNTLGSQSSHSKQCSFILSAWSGQDGGINPTTAILRPAHVMYYFDHNMEINGIIFKKTHLHFYNEEQWIVVRC